MKDFWVECDVCKTQYKNWSGSTPCCGSIAYIINELGETTHNLSLYTSIKYASLDMSEDKEEKKEE